MSLKSSSSFVARLVALVSTITAGSAVQAASISYPAQGPIAPGYTFTNIVESSGTDGVPLYGPPSPILIGLDFAPTSFTASTTGGGADVTDGQLNYTVTSGPNAPGIPFISFSEGGSYTLSGTGTATTQVMAGAILRATILEINGAPVAPINLPPVSASVAYNLPANPGVSLPWAINATLNVAAFLSPGQVATKADVVINNALVAVSEGGRFSSVATISKGDFGSNITPEPGCALMMGLALCGAILGGRRR